MRKKKTRILPILFIITCCIFSCRKNTSVQTLLTQAEALMEQSPDSSLVLLRQIESPEKLSGRQQALWCLLLTQANDKNYIKHTSDSLMKIAVSYFEKSEDPEYLMKSYYYAAAIYHDMGASPHAQEFYLKALNAGKHSDDHAMLGRIYSNLGSLYTFQKLYDTALDFEKKAVNHFSAINDSTNTGKILRNIGRIFSATNKADSALFYYTEALSFATPQNRATIYSEIGNLYKHTKEYDKTYQFITLALESLLPHLDTIPIYHNLGEYYRLIGQYDSAIYYLNKCIQSQNLRSARGAYLNLAYVEEKRQNWQTSTAYYKKYQQLQDSVNKITQTENLQRIQSLFNYQQIEKDRNFHQHKADEKTISFYRLLIIFILTLVFFILSFMYIQKKKREERIHHDQLLRIEQQKYMQSEEYLKKKEAKINELEQILANEKQKKAIEYTTIYDQFHASQLYKNLTAFDVKENGSDWDELESWVEKISPDFTARLKVLHPGIDISELRMCYLKKVRFSVHPIAQLLSISDSAITQKSKRLYKKLTGEYGSAKEMDDFIENF